MSDWTYEKVFDDIYLCRERGYKETANIFVVVQEGHALLIDAGTSGASLKEIANTLQVTFDACFITHGHFDHVFGIVELQCPVYASLACREHLLYGKDFGLEYFSIDDVVEKQNVRSRYNGISTRISDLSSKARSVVVMRENFQWGKYSLEPKPLVGHSDDSMGFLLEPVHVLFTGDAFYNGKLYFFTESSSVTAGLQSLKKIEDIAPQKILPGHNEILESEDTASVLQDWREQLST
jgi:glyoxylase-like metal-dependent hydrolase (beta-lactamase superfamily II)